MHKPTNDFLLFSGSSHPTLSQQVAKHLNVPLSSIEINKFPDGEIGVQIVDSVRGQDVFVLQSIAVDPNYYLVELLIIIDALKRSSAKTINVITPYYGYSRQDRKDKPRVPITAKLVANLLTAAGVNRLITLDLHTSQTQGFFDIPVENLYARPLLIEAFGQYITKNVIVVTPDIGSIKLGRSYSEQLQVGMAIVDKQRISPTKIKDITVIGDVKDKDVLLADDMCTTGITLALAAKACQEKGARAIYAAVTHGLFVLNAIEVIEQSPILALLVSDTIPINGKVLQSKKITVVSIAPLIAKAIHCILSKESITSLYDIDGCNI
ncbi:Ribose-phosphate pyrophosphokinase [Candidatus Rubidus massiliensis]|nr:MAG: ribose-phosphate pyrophosphokinase [Chlamydia sp. 32-24]CDZ80377.1 Ribose-phosphate pyrophosphokinase [Candidatus Rubidus massiliensis]